MGTVRPVRRALIPVCLTAAILAGASSALVGSCGPFTDEAADAFCPFVLEIFYLGITTGTTATTFDPTSTSPGFRWRRFSRERWTGALKRGSRRAALDQFWTTQNATVLGVTTVGAFSAVRPVRRNGHLGRERQRTVSRVRGERRQDAGDLDGSRRVPTACSRRWGRFFVTGTRCPGNLYEIDPSSRPGRDDGGEQPRRPRPPASPSTARGSGRRTSGGSGLDRRPPAPIPWTVTTVTTGFIDDDRRPVRRIEHLGHGASAGTSLEARFDRRNSADRHALRVSAFPVFDGANIWVPDFTGS